MKNDLDVFSLIEGLHALEEFGCPLKIVQGRVVLYRFLVKSDEGLYWR